MHKLFFLSVLLSYTLAGGAVWADETAPVAPAADADSAPVAKGDTKKAVKPKTHAKSKAKTGDEKAGAKSENSHDRGSGKRAVMALSTLTDKQKSQLQTIYDGKKSEWDALSKQMHALREAEWKEVKPILTPEQLAELRTNKNKARSKKRDGDSNN